MGKKVLFVSTGVGHTMNFTGPIFRYFQNQDYEVHFASKQNGDKRVENFLANGIICHDLSTSRNPFSANSIYALLQLIILMKRQRFNLVFAQSPVGGFLGRFSAKITNTKPVIYMAHGFHFYKGAPLLNWLIYYPIERIAAHWTDCLITINNEDFLRAKKFTLHEKGKVYHVNGVGVDIKEYGIQLNDDELRYYRKKLNLQDNDTTFICIGELNKGKNQKQIILALSKVLRKTKNIKVLIVGEGPLAVKLKNLAKKTGVIECIQFLGYRNDIPQLLYVSDALILTSYREGLPRCIMEAMAAGKPVIATDIRGNRELVSPGVNGFLVPVNGISETANAIMAFSLDKALQKKMGIKSKELVVPYSIDNVIKEQVKIISKYIQ